MDNHGRAVPAAQLDGGACAPALAEEEGVNDLAVMCDLLVADVIVAHIVWCTMIVRRGKLSVWKMQHICGAPCEPVYALGLSARNNLDDRIRMPSDKVADKVEDVLETRVRPAADYTQSDSRR